LDEEVLEVPEAVPEEVMLLVQRDEKREHRLTRPRSGPAPRSSRYCSDRTRGKRFESNAIRDRASRDTVGGGRGEVGRRGRNSVSNGVSDTVYNASPILGE